MSDQPPHSEGSGESSGESAGPNNPDSAAPNAKPIKHELGPETADEDDDEDNVPLAFSRAHKNKKLANTPKAMKEEPDREDDHKRSKGKTPRKEGAGCNGKLSRVKKEETQDSDDEEWTSKGKTLKKVAAKGSGKVTKVKKEEAHESEEDDQKARKSGGGKSSANSSKDKKREPHDSDEEEEKSGKDKKKKKRKIDEKKVIRKVGKVVTKQGKEKKVYDLPGQKHNPPEERDPLRIFYETLHTQVPNSEMAAVWMMEWGLLPPAQAKKVYEKKIKKSQLQKLGSPIKVASVKKTSIVSMKKVTKIASETVSKTLQKPTKKRKAPDSGSDGDDNFIISKKIRKKISN